MLLHQSADLDYNLDHACDPWHMHQDLHIERREEEDVNTYIRVANLRFRICELPDCYLVKQVAFRVDVESVLVSAV